MLDLRKHVRRFFFSSIGDGRSSNAWEDTWVECGALAEHISYRNFCAGGFSLNSTVRDVLDTINGDWPLPWTERWPDLGSHTIPIIQDSIGDRILWKGPNDMLQEFTVSNAWRSMEELYPTAPWYKFVWFKGYIPKHAFCMWSACLQRLPTQDRIGLWKHDPPDLQCVFCGDCPDSHNHLFFGCAFSVKVWRRIKCEANMYGFREDWDGILNGLADGSLKLRSTAQKLSLSATVYYIWQERNRRLFRNQRRSEEQLAKDIVELVLLRVAWKTRIRKIPLNDNES